MGSSNPVPLAGGAAAASASASTPANTVAAVAAKAAAVQVATAVTLSSATLTGASLSSVPQTSSSIAAVLYVGAGPGTPPNASPPPAPAKAVLTLGQTDNSNISTFSVPSPTIAVPTAHDAVFSQIEEESCSVADGLLSRGKVDSAASLATVLNLGKVGVSAAMSPQPQSSRTSTRRNERPLKPASSCYG